MTNAWDVHRLLKEPDRGVRGLHAMCDSGAKQVKAGRADGLLFNVMPDEVAVIKSYMSVRHPGVPFFCSYPAWGAGLVRSDKP